MQQPTGIKVVRTSERGALLITDGVRMAWIMGHQRRPNGTFTKGALEALADGKTVEEHEAERTAYLAAREKAFQDGKLPVSITIAKERIFDYSEKAWKIRMDRQQYLYGRWCFCYEYLPKSMVSIDINDQASTACLTMPRWFLEKHRWIKDFAIQKDRQ